MCIYIYTCRYISGSWDMSGLSEDFLVYTMTLRKPPVTPLPGIWRACRSGCVNGWWWRWDLKGFGMSWNDGCHSSGALAF